MADETNQGTPPATPPATPADAGNAAKPEALLNYKEVVELRKETRETRDLLKQLLDKSGRSEPAPAAAPTAPAAPKDPPKGDEVTTRVQALESELVTMRRDGAIKDAFLEHGITDPDLRDLIKSAAATASPTDVAGIVAKYAKFKPAVAQSQSTTAPAAQSVATGTSNTGAAGGEARTQIPNDVLAVSKEAWTQLSPEEKRARYEADKRSRGVDHNPFAASKPRPK